MIGMIGMKSKELDRVLFTGDLQKSGVQGSNYAQPSYSQAIAPQMKTYKWNAILLASLICVLASAPAKADDAPAKSFQDYADLSLEQLVNVKVTSVSKKETELSLSPAAISVVTGEDIRRLGITTIPEALRLVPGMDVARVNGNEWAVNARGFNDEFAKSLLVLIDGRTVYTPASGGVFWNAQDVVMEDLARIEVIRGPGATLWGANAVNGVINIISKPAKETQGALVSTAAGTEDQPTTTARYGGQLGTNLYYRVYAKYFNRDGLVDSTGRDAADDWRMARGGFRVDWEQSPENLLTLQGDGYGGHAARSVSSVSLNPAATQLATGREQNDGANVLGRWTHTFSEASQLSLQGYYDYFKEDDGNGTEYSHTLDFDLQDHFALGTRNDIVCGAGFRHASIQNTSDFNLAWTPETQQIQLFNVFAQDDIMLVPERLHLTLGSKFEHNSLVGLEIQPSGRLLWTPGAHQTVWAGVSRAARTPSLFERNARLNVAAFQPPGSPPVLVSILGNPAVTAEKVTAYELGYRVEPTPRLSFDLAGFFNQYSDLLVTPSNPFQFRSRSRSAARPHFLDLPECGLRRNLRRGIIGPMAGHGSLAAHGQLYLAAHAIASGFFRRERKPAATISTPLIS